ncbi:MAG: Os1348 family NHLP clan protein [Dehalococcoidia bacterium]
MATVLAVREDKGKVQVVPGGSELRAVLERAAKESEFLAKLAEDPHEALKEYYSLTAEERAALASGDIRRIESWVGKLDIDLATWLWCRLCQEKW